MLYDYQYSIIAIVVNVFLIILTYQRRGYPTIQTRIFTHLLFCNLALTIVDIFTFYTISYPERYSVLTLYLSNIVYVILFCTMTCSAFCYIATLIDDPRYIRYSLIIFFIIIAIESVLTLSTYWTHWIIYFDDDLVYRHGPLFILMYIFPIFMLTVIIFSFYFGQSHFNSLQKKLAIGLSLFGIAMGTFQILIPRFDSLTVSFAFILFMFYAVYENPSYSTYHDTYCYNYRALYKACEDLKRKNKNPEIVLLGIMNHSRNHGIQEINIQNRLMDTIADRLFLAFRNQVFCISDGKFLIITKKKGLIPAENTSSADKIADKLVEILNQPVKIGNNVIQVSYRTRVFHFMDLSVSDDFIDHLIEGFQQTPIDRLFFVDSLVRIIKEQHEYREIEDILSYAIKEDKFEVYFQPIYHIRTGRFRSAEAMLRLFDDSGQSISPALLVAIAEKNGNIIKLDELIFEKICRFLKEHNLSDLGLEYIETNISPIQFEQKDMAYRFIDIVEKYQISPSFINLEILESAFQTSTEYVEKNISILKKYGFHFSIDDYGSGFASTGYLFNFPISLVKIDKSILWQAMKNADGSKIFRRTISLINELDKGVVVEGAENEEMVVAIKEAGAHYIQGFYFSKPLPGEDFISFLSENNK